MQKYQAQVRSLPHRHQGPDGIIALNLNAIWPVNRCVARVVVEWEGGECHLEDPKNGHSACMNSGCSARSAHRGVQIDVDSSIIRFTVSAFNLCNNLEAA